MNKLIIFLLLVPFYSIAQRIEKNYIDKFTKTRHIITTDETLVNSYGTTTLSAIGSILISKDSIRQNCLTFYFISPSTGSLKETSKMIIVDSTGNATEIPYKGEYQLFTSNKYVYFPIYLNDEELKLWSSRIITDIRIDYIAEYSIKRKNQDKLPGICRLLLHTIEINK